MKEPADQSAKTKPTTLGNRIRVAAAVLFVGAIVFCSREAVPAWSTFHLSWPRSAYYLIVALAGAIFGLALTGGKLRPSVILGGAACGIGSMFAPGTLVRECRQYPQLNRLPGRPSGHDPRRCVVHHFGAGGKKTLSAEAKTMTQKRILFCARQDAGYHDSRHRRVYAGDSGYLRRWACFPQDGSSSISATRMRP